MEQKEKQKIVRINEVADRFGCCKKTVYRYVERGVLVAPFKVGVINGWYEKDIDEAISKLGLNVEVAANG